MRKEIGLILILIVGVFAAFQLSNLIYFEGFASDFSSSLLGTTSHSGSGLLRSDPSMWLLMNAEEILMDTFPENGTNFTDVLSLNLPDIVSETIADTLFPSENETTSETLNETTETNETLGETSDGTAGRICIEWAADETAETNEAADETTETNETSEDALNGTGASEISNGTSDETTETTEISNETSSETAGRICIRWAATETGETSETSNETAEANITGETPESTIPTEEFRLQVSYIGGLEPDFSNLLVEYINESNQSENISYTIVSSIPSESVIISLARPLLEGETIRTSAAEVAQELPFEVVATGTDFTTVSSDSGNTIEISNDAISALSNDETVRIIAKSDGASPSEEHLSEAGMDPIKSLPNNNIEVLEVNASDINALADMGIDQIYVDTEMEMSLTETIPLIRADLSQSELNMTGEGIAVCLLDTGVDFTLPSLEGKAVSGYDFINNDEDASDDNGHGTLMASAIHAAAPNAIILSVKVLGADGRGFSSDTIAGIDYCRQLAPGGIVRIIALPFGGGNHTDYCDSDPVAQEANLAATDGMFVVSSAGNKGASYITAPACGSGVTAVSSTSKSDTISSFSNMNALVDLLAPGEDVLAEGMSGPQSVSGTSISASHVAGAAALLLQSSPSLTPSEAEQRFRTTGKLIEYDGANYTRIDAYNAITNNFTGMPSEQPELPENETNETVPEENYTYEAQLNVNVCGALGSAGATYVLTSPLNISASTCLNVTAENVTINCASFAVVGDDSPETYGIYSNGSNTIVQNCNISNFSIAVYFNGTTNGTIDNCTVNTTMTSGMGVRLENNANYNTISNTTAAAIDDAIYLGGSSNNTIANTTATTRYGQQAGNWGYLGTAIGLYSSSNNTIAEATANGHIVVSTSSNNTITSTNATAIEAPIGLTGSSYNTIINMTAIATYGRAVDLASGSNSNTLANITALPSSGYNAIHIDSSHNNTIANSTATAYWSYAIYLNSASNNTISNATLEDIGTGANWALLYIESTAGNNTFYWNNFTQTCDKYVIDLNGSNIWNGSAYGINEGNIWHNVMTGEVVIPAGAASAIPGLSIGTTAYTDANSNGKTANVTDFVPLTTGAINTSAEGECGVCRCGVISTPGYICNLTSSQSSNGSTCFNVTAENATINCAGFSITGNNSSSTYGIYSNSSSTTMMNCNIGNFSHGVYFSRVANGAIRNTTASTTFTAGNGIYLFYSSHNTITDSAGNTASGSGIYIFASTHSNITNSNGTATSSGVSLGIDLTTNSNNNTITNCTGTAHGTGRAIHIGTSSSNNTISNSVGNATASGIGINVEGGSSNNKVANSNGTSDSGYGIYVTISSGNNITDSNSFSALDSATVLDTATNTVIRGLNSTGGASGLFVYYSANNNISGSRFAGSGMSDEYWCAETGHGAVHFGCIADADDDSSGNLFTNNTFTSGNNTTLVYLDVGTTANTFYWNNFTNTSGLYVNDTSGGNYYNATTQYATNEGNIYAEVLAGTVNIVGLNSSSGFPSLMIGFAGSGFPYSSNTSGKVTSGVADYAPLTNTTACACGVLSTANYNCTLYSNQQSNATCFTVNASNITIDCAGFPITGNNSTATYGIYSSQPNTTIRNCNISNFSTAIYFNGSTNGTIDGSTASTTFASAGTDGIGILLGNGANYNTIANSTASATNYAISLSGSSVNNITNTTAAATSEKAIYLTSSSNNAIRNTTATAANRYAIYLTSSSDGNTIANTTATSADRYAIYLNSSNNNTLSNTTATAATNYAIYLTSSTNSTIANTTAIAGTSYAIYLTSSTNSTIANTTAIAGTSYAIYLTSSSDGNTIANTTATASTTSYAIYLTSSSNNTIANATATAGTTYAISLDSSSNYNSITNTTATAGSDYAISLSSSSGNTVANSTAAATGYYAISLDTSSNSTIANTTATAAASAISLSSSSGNTIANSTAAATDDTIYLYYSPNNTIANSTADATGNNAIYLTSSSDNTISNNTLTSSSGTARLAYLVSSSSGNTFYWNNFTSTSGLYVDDTNGSNHYNATTPYATNEGNIWPDILNGTVNIVGLNSSSGFPSLMIGFAGANYPYSNNTSAKLFGNVADYAPLTNTTACACGVLSTANYNCTLYFDQQSNATCFTVNASNITIDCNGFSITGNNSTGAYGIYSSQSNTSIQNCTISSFDTGIYSNGSSNGAMRATVSSYNSNYGIFMEGNSDNNTIADVSANDTNGAIQMSSSSNNTFTRFNASASSNAIYAYTGSSDNNFTDAVFMSDSQSGIYFTGASEHNTFAGLTAMSVSSPAINLDTNFNIIMNSTATATSHIGTQVSGAYNNFTGFNSTGSSNGIRILSGGDNNTFTNVRASSVSDTALSVDSAQNTFNTVTASHTGSGASAYGAMISAGSRNNMTNSTIHSNSSYGLYIHRTSHFNTIANSTISSTSQSAMFFHEQWHAPWGASDYYGTENNTIVNNTFLSNGTYPLVNTGKGAMNNVFYWNNFTNASSYYVNCSNTNNYFNATVSGHQEGNIWGNIMNGSIQVAGTTNSSGFPTLYIGIGGSGYPYTDANSGGKTINVTDNAPLTPAAACTCGVLSTANYICTLLFNQTSNATCFTVNATNVTIECAGFSITGNNSSDTYGIYSNQSNTTMSNCNISNFSTAIYFNGSTSGTIQNTTAAATSMAINIYSSSNNTIANSTATATEYQAIRLVSSSNFNTITNTTATATISYAFLLDTSFNNTIANSTATAADNAIYLTGSSNNTIANSTADATATDYAIYLASSSYNTVRNTSAAATGSNAVYLDTSSENNTFANMTSSAANSAFRLTDSSNNMIANSTATATGNGAIRIASSANTTITNTTATAAGSFGIRIDAGTYGTITNTTASAGSDYGISLASGSENNTITDTAATASNQFAILIDSSSGNNITNTTATAAGSTAIRILSGSSNTIANSTTNASGNAISLEGSGNTVINNTLISSSGTGMLAYISSDASANTFYWNNFTDTSGLYVNDTNGSNYFNATTQYATNEGNIWPDILNGTVNIVGLNSSSGFPSLLIGFAGANYPYSSTYSSKVVGATDYAPLTNTTACACGVLSVDNYLCTLYFSQQSNATCFTVNASNVTVDCAGFSITGNNSTSTFGIYSNQFNTTIRNCRISNFQYGIYFNGATNGTLQNDTANTTHSSGIGLYLISSNYNSISNATASAATMAIGLGGSNNNIFTDVNANATGNYAVYLMDPGASNNTFTNVNATADNYTIYMSTMSSIYNNTFTNLNATATGIYAIHLTSFMMGTTTFNTITNSTATAAGNYTVYITLNAYNNTIANTTFISSSGTGTHILLTSGATANTFYWNNFTNTSGLYVNDTVGGNYYNATTPYATNEGNIWPDIMNGSVQVAGSTSSSGFPTLYIGAGGSGYPYSSATSGKVAGATDNAPITPSFSCTCGVLSTANYICNLTINLSSTASTCFNVTAENVTINCAGFSITGNNSTSTYGMYSGKFNTTIANCNISGYNYGIFLNGSTYGSALNDTVTAYSGNHGVYLSSSNYTTIANTTATSDSGYGIYLASSSNFNNITNSTGTSNSSYGIYLSSSSNNTISSSNGTTASRVGIYLSSSANNNTISNCTGAAGTSGYGIQLSGNSKNTLTNSIITSNTNYSIYLSGTSNNNTIANCTATSNTSNALNMANSNYNIIANSTFTSTSGAPMAISRSGTPAMTAKLNTLYNNTIISTAGTQILVSLITGATNNTFYWNNFTGTSGLYVNDTNTSNFYNATVSGHQEGNIWHNIMNGSVQVGGQNSSSGFPSLYIGAFGSGYPYSNNTTAKITSGVVDYAPLTNHTDAFPQNATISFINASNSHSFLVNASVNDTDGGTDIVATNISTDYGNCTYISNSTSGITFTAIFNCTSTLPGTANVSVGFTDSFGIYNNTSTSSNEYPDHAPALTQPTITPSPAYANDTLTCNNGTFSDIDSDTENVSSRTWQWYRNGTLMAGQTNSTLAAYNFVKGDNLSCEETVFANNWTAYNATNMSSNITINNSLPFIAVQPTFSNVTVGHSFNVTAGVTDMDGAGDILSTNISTTEGYCAYLTNSSIGYNFNVTYNCTGNYTSTTSIVIGFTDTSAAYVNTSTASNAYPDHAPALTQPTITPSPAYANDTLTCNNGTFSDIDSDTENVSSRTWQWYRNGTLMAGQTNSTLAAYNFVKGDNLSCEETVFANNWTAYNATNMSSNITINNSLPFIAVQPTFSNVTVGHSFNVTAGVTDMDGAGDILSTNISTTEGACVYLTNATDGAYNFNVTYNCTGNYTSTTSIVIGFTDTSAAYVNTSTASNGYPDHAPAVTQPTITPTTAYANDTLTCNNGTFSDIDSDTENVSSRSWQWYRNGTVMAGQTNSTLTAYNFVKNDNISCQETVFANNWTVYNATNMSNNITINNSLPFIAVQPTFSNVSIGHSFNVTAGITDMDGAGDIASTNISTTEGTCAYLTNSSISYNFNVTYNCTGNYTSTASIVVGFTDTSTAYVNTSTASNGYPDNAPAVTKPTITPSPAYANDTLICNNGTFSDIDSDTENVSSRSWQWYRNGTIMAGQTNNTLAAYNFVKGDNLSCQETVFANNWTAYNATNMSSNITINNSLPFIAVQPTFSNVTIGHSFNVTAGVTDMDGAGDILSTNISTTEGACAYLTNSSISYNFNVTYNCTGNFTSTASIVIGFTDTSAAYVNTSTASNGYPDNAPALTQPTITPSSAYVNNTLTCNNGTFSDIDSDTENITTRTWIWYLNGTAMANQTNNTLASYSFTKHDNISCRETVFANNWTAYNATNLSNNTTIQNSVPIIAHTPTFSNVTIGHSFNVTAGVTDMDGASDINYTNATITDGTCAYLTNSSSGFDFNVTYNCTGTYTSTPNVTISFTDMDNASNSTTSANGYPDNAPSILAPVITPNSPAFTYNTLTCNPQAFSDIDSDTENTTSRTWMWYRNGAAISGQTGQTLAPASFTLNDLISCRETVFANNWTAYNATNISANVTITTPTSGGPNTGGGSTTYSTSTPALSSSFNCSTGAFNVTAKTWGGVPIPALGINVNETNETEVTDSSGTAHFYIVESGSYNVRTLYTSYYTVASATYPLVMCMSALENITNITQFNETNVSANATPYVPPTPPQPPTTALPPAGITPSGPVSIFDWIISTLKGMVYSVLPSSQAAQPGTATEAAQQQGGILLLLLLIAALAILLFIYFKRRKKAEKDEGLGNA